MQYINNYAENEFNGYAVKQWLEENADIAMYISIAYLTFAFKGPILIRWLFQDKPPIAFTKKMWVLWNFALSVFSLWGSIITVPAAINNIRHLGLHDAVCICNEEQIYLTKVGFAICAFAISKLPEFGDTFFLIFTGKQSLPLINWFHHVTIFLYCWFAYQHKSSILIYLAGMNYTVHTIMYFYFALAEAGYKKLVKPFGIYITLLQITQMVCGLYLSGLALMYVYGYNNNETDENVKHTFASKAVIRAQFAVYVANFLMFANLFIKGYILPRNKVNAKRE